MAFIPSKNELLGKMVGFRVLYDLRKWPFARSDPFSMKLTNWLVSKDSIDVICSVLVRVPVLRVPVGIATAIRPKKAQKRTKMVAVVNIFPRCEVINRCL